MKKFKLFIFSLALPVSTFGIELGKELISNGNFEEGVENWKIVSPAQDGNDFGGEKRFIRIQDRKLVMNANPALKDGYLHYVTATQCIEIGDGKTFRFSADFNQSTLPISPYQHRVNISWYTKADCSAGGQFGDYIEPAQKLGIQTLKKSNLKPSLNATAVQIEVSQKRDETMSAGTWDNLSFVAYELKTQNAEHFISPTDSLPLNQNLILNSGFDTGTDHWRKYSNLKWIASEGDSNLGAVKVSMHSNSGSSGSGALEQCVNISSHQNFKVGASYKMDEASTQTGGGRLRIAWFEEEDCKGAHATDTKDADPIVKSGWQRLSITHAKAPKNARSVAVEIIQSISGDGDFSAAWDDIYLVALPD